jgi:hypothetical protein
LNFNARSDLVLSSFSSSYNETNQVVSITVDTDVVVLVMDVMPTMDHLSIMDVSSIFVQGKREKKMKLRVVVVEW